MVLTTCMKPAYSRQTVATVSRYNTQIKHDRLKKIESQQELRVRSLTSSLLIIWRKKRFPSPTAMVYEHQDGSKSLKLGDFGLATLVDGPLYTVCGTPTYVAPEIIAETGYGLKVDIWAAGVITYILLCGFPPFRGSSEDQEALFDQILMGQLDFPLPYWDNISDSAKELITSMLQVDVDQRYSALQVLDHPWVNDDGLPENEHQLSVAGKIKKHFNTGPKPNSTTAGVSVITTTALDKERQVFRRRRHQDVRPAPRPPQSSFLSATAATAAAATSPSPADFTSESEDYSPSSAETVRSPNSPF